MCIVDSLEQLWLCVNDIDCVWECVGGLCVCVCAHLSAGSMLLLCVLCGVKSTLVVVGLLWLCFMHVPAGVFDVLCMCVLV